MKDPKQETVADVLHNLRDAFIVGIVNEYELAGKILDAIHFDDMPSHDCKLDEYMSGKCNHPSHDFELVDQVPCYECNRDGEPCVEHRSQTESEAHSFAH